MKLITKSWDGIPTDIITVFKPKEIEGISYCTRCGKKYDESTHGMLPQRILNRVCVGDAVWQVEHKELPYRCAKGLPFFLSEKLPIKDIFKKHLNAFLAQNITSKSEFQKAFERAEKEVLEQLNEYENQLAHKVRLAVYWERRCKAAENFALFVPSNWESDSDKAKAYEKWQESKENFPIPPKE